MSIPSKESSSGKQVNAYTNMLQRVRHALEEIEDDIGMKLHYAIDAAKEKAFTLGELTREEAEQIGDYIQRDIQDAAEYLAAEGRELSDWLKFDIKLVEDHLADMLSHAINTSALEWQQLAERAAQENLWYMGEVTGPGTFECAECGHNLSFYHIQDIPACPECGSGRFRRLSEPT